MTNFIGNSILPTTYVAGGAGTRGPQGPQGPDGNFGFTGGTGPTGNTGYGFKSILKTNPNTVTVTLDNDDTIIITGLTGAPGTAPTVYSSSPYYKIEGVVTEPTDGAYLIKQVDGVTATFKVLSPVGFTLTYTGNDLVVSAAAALTSSLQEGKIIGASGITAISFSTLGYSAGSAYDYVSANIGPLLTTTNAAYDSGLGMSITQSHGTVPNTILNSLNNNGDVFTHKHWWRINDGSSNQIVLVDFGAEVYSITYPYTAELGSCCFCHNQSADPEDNTRVCFDYITKTQCDGLSGSYSSTPCSTRTVNDTSNCGPMVVGRAGICCTCGSNYENGDTAPNIGSCTQALNETECIALGFTFIPTQGNCSSSDAALCAGLDCSQVKKKLIKLASKTYPSEYTCAISDDGNVICWGPLLGTNVYAIRTPEQPVDWFADDISIGENHVLILAKPIKYENGSPVIDSYTQLPVLDQTKSKLFSKVFLKSALEDTLVSKASIDIATLGNANEEEKFETTLDGKLRFYSAGPQIRIDKDYFIGAKSSNKELYASGTPVSISDELQYDLFPLPEGEFINISGMWHHVCGVRSNGDIVCWGDNIFGQTNQPPDSSKYTQVVTGKYHTCGLDIFGNVKCWGAGTTVSGWPHYGQSIIPLGLSGEKVVQIGAGFYYSAALTDKGNVFTWGAFRGLTFGYTSIRSDFADEETYRGIRKNLNNQLVPYPQELNTVKARKIACAPYSIAVLGQNNKLYGWGHDGRIGSTADTGVDRVLKGIPSALERFNRAIEREQLQLDIADFAVDRSDNVYVLINQYGCSGNTFSQNIFGSGGLDLADKGLNDPNLRDCNPGLTGVVIYPYHTNYDYSNGKRPGDSKWEEYKLWEESVAADCFNCEIMTECEYRYYKNLGLTTKDGYYSKFGYYANQAKFISNGITGMQDPSEKPRCIVGGTFIADQIYETCKPPGTEFEANDPREVCYSGGYTLCNGIPACLDNYRIYLPNNGLETDGFSPQTYFNSFQYDTVIDGDNKTREYLYKTTDGSFKVRSQISTDPDEYAYRWSPDPNNNNEKYEARIQKPLPTCTPIEGCTKFINNRSIIFRANNKACINCYIGDECDFRDLLLAHKTMPSGGIGGVTAQYFVSDNHCFFRETQEYVWETEDNVDQLYPVFRGLDACIDLDRDGNDTNDEDDLLGCNERILKEQYLLKFNESTFTRDYSIRGYPDISSTIIENNVCCTNRSILEPLWTDKKNAYSGWNICEKKKEELLTDRWYTPEYIKQEIIRLDTSGQMAYYVMKRDYNFFITDKLVNFNILTNTTALDRDYKLYKSFISNSGELVLITRTAGDYGTNSWANAQVLNLNSNKIGETAPFSCSSYNLLSNRYYLFNSKNQCGNWPSDYDAYLNNSSRRVLSASLGYKHGVYVVSDSLCFNNVGITFDFDYPCKKGHIVSIANGTGLTALNGYFGIENELYSSSFWKAVKNKSSSTNKDLLGITSTHNNYFIQGIERMIDHYQVSSGYYHSCAIIDEPLTVKWNGIDYEYNAGDVVCWGAGDPGLTLSPFSFDQAKGITYSDGAYAEQVSCGLFHTIVLENDGENKKHLKAFGAGSSITGLEGNYSLNQCIIPTDIQENASSIKYISAGPFYSGVVIQRTDGLYYENWGGRWNVKIRLKKDVADISSGNEHVVFLYTDGTVDCVCRDNNNGKCDIAIQKTYTDKRYIHITAKDNVTFAIDNDNLPYVFGNLQNKLEEVPPELETIPDGRIIKSISAGKDHNLVLLGWLGDSTNVGEVKGFGNDEVLTEGPNPDVRWVKSGNASNTTIVAVDTPYKQLKIYGDGRNNPYTDETVYSLGLIGITGISKYNFEYMIDTFGGLYGTTMTEYLQFIRRERLKDPINTGYGCKTIAADGFRSAAIKSFPDIKWNTNDIGYSSRVIPWGLNYKQQPRSLRLLTEHYKLHINTSSSDFGSIYASRIVPTDISANRLGVAVRLKSYYIKVGNDTSPLVKYDDYWVSYGDNSNYSLGTLIGNYNSDGDFESYIKEFKGLNQYVISLRIPGYTNPFWIKQYSNVSIGNWHTLGLIEVEDPTHPTYAYNGTVVAWGDRNILENYGQFDTPVDSNGTPLKFKTIRAGYYHNIGILEDGTVHCWGGNGPGINYGQIDVPIDPTTGRKIKAVMVDLGRYHSVAITADGRFFGWGAGSDRYKEYNDRLINPHYGQASGPKNEDGIPYRFKSISAGDYHTGGILPDGSILLWGDNSNSACNENYSKTNKFDKIECASQYTIGLTEDGIVYGWGFGSAESPESQIIMNTKNPGFSILSAFPPRESMGLSDFGKNMEMKLDKDINNIIGENNIAITKDTESKVYDQYGTEIITDVLDTWGDNSFGQTEFFDELFVNEFRSQYYNINAEINEELSIFYNYGSSFVNRNPFKYEDGKIYQFTDGHGLNAGLKYDNYILSGGDLRTLNEYPVSRIEGITGTPLPIFTDYGSRYKNEFYSKGIVLSHGWNDYQEWMADSNQRWSTNPLYMNNSTQGDGYYGIGPTQFFMIEGTKDTSGAVIEGTIAGSTAYTFYCNTPRDHFKWSIINKTPRKLPKEGTDYPEVFTDGTLVPDSSLGEDGGNLNLNNGFAGKLINGKLAANSYSYKSTFGINWGLAKDSTGKLVVKEYDWLDAYGFALGWNPNTGERMDYFDLHHNIWNVDQDIKNELPECPDCDFIADIKNGFTPLESISGRFGHNVYTLNMDTNNQHGVGRGMIKVCGKIDLTKDEKLLPWVRAVQWNQCGENCDLPTVPVPQGFDNNSRSSCKMYVIDTVALFGSMFYANLEASYPLEYSDHAENTGDLTRKPNGYFYEDFKYDKIILNDDGTSSVEERNIGCIGDGCIGDYYGKLDLRDNGPEHARNTRVPKISYSIGSNNNIINKPGYVDRYDFTRWLGLKYFWKQEDICDALKGCNGDPNTNRLRYSFRPDNEHKDTLWVCFHVYGNFNWGDNSKGQLGKLPASEESEVVKEQYKEKPWIPAFLNANINLQTTSQRAAPISCGMYHTLYDYHEVASQTYKTLKDPYQRIRVWYDHSECFPLREGQTECTTDKLYFTPKTIFFNPKKVIHNGPFIQTVPCGFRLDGKTYRTGGQIGNKTSEELGPIKFAFPTVKGMNHYPYKAGNFHNYTQTVVEGDDENYFANTWGGTTYDAQSLTVAPTYTYEEYWIQDCGNRLGLSAAVNNLFYGQCCTCAPSRPEGCVAGVDDWRCDPDRNGCLMDNCSAWTNTCLADCPCTYCEFSIESCYYDPETKQYKIEENWKPCSQRSECVEYNDPTVCSPEKREEDRLFNCRRPTVDFVNLSNLEHVSSRYNHNLFITQQYNTDKPADWNLYRELIFSGATTGITGEVTQIDWETQQVIYGGDAHDGLIAEGTFVNGENPTGTFYLSAPGITYYVSKYQNLILIGPDNKYGQASLPPRVKTNDHGTFRFRSSDTQQSKIISGITVSCLGPGYKFGDCVQDTSSFTNNQLLTAAAGKYHNCYIGYTTYNSLNCIPTSYTRNITLPYDGRNAINDNDYYYNVGNPYTYRGTLKGFTYSLYDQKVVMWGATYANQLDLPEELIPTTTGKTLLEHNFGYGEILNIDWSVDSLRVLISYKNGRIVILDGIRLSQGSISVLANIDTGYTDLVKVLWQLPNRLLIVRKYSIKTETITMASGTPLGAALRLKSDYGGGEYLLTLNPLDAKSTISDIDLLYSTKFFYRTLRNLQLFYGSLRLSLPTESVSGTLYTQIKLDSKAEEIYWTSPNPGVETGTITLKVNIGPDDELTAQYNKTTINSTDIKFLPDEYAIQTAYDRTFDTEITKASICNDSNNDVALGFVDGTVLIIGIGDTVTDLNLKNRDTTFNFVTNYNWNVDEVTALQHDRYGHLYAGYKNGSMRSWDEQGNLKWVSIAKLADTLLPEYTWHTEPIGSITSVSPLQWLNNQDPYSDAPPVFWSSTRSIMNNELLKFKSKLKISETTNSEWFKGNIQITDNNHIKYILDIFLQELIIKYEKCVVRYPDYGPDYQTCMSSGAANGECNFKFKYVKDGIENYIDLFGYIDTEGQIFTYWLRDFIQRYKDSKELLIPIKFYTGNKNINDWYSYNKFGPILYKELNNIDAYKLFKLDGILGQTLNINSSYINIDMGDANTRFSSINGITFNNITGSKLEKQIIIANQKNDSSFGMRATNNIDTTIIGVVEQDNLGITPFEPGSSEYVGKWNPTTRGLHHRHSSLLNNNRYFNIEGKNYKWDDADGLNILMASNRNTNYDDTTEIIKIACSWKITDTRDDAVYNLFYFTVGTDNDIRITEHNFDNMDSNSTWNLICPGERDSTGKAKPEKQIVDAVWDTDTTKIIAGHKDGTIKIFDPFNRYVLVTPGITDLTKSRVPLTNQYGIGTTNIIKLDAGDDHTCLQYKDTIEDAIKIVCWGDNTDNQCSVPNNKFEQHRLIIPGYYPNLLYCGGYHNCLTGTDVLFGITTATYPLCWGRNTHKQTEIEKCDPLSISLGREFTSWIVPTDRSSRCSSSFRVGGVKIKGNLKDFDLNTPNTSYSGTTLEGVILGNSYNLVVAGTTHAIALQSWRNFSDQGCDGTTLFWTIGYDLFGNKVPCIDDPNWSEGLSENSISFLRGLTSSGYAITRTNITNGFYNMYLHGDNSVGQSNSLYDINTTAIAKKYFYTEYNDFGTSPGWSYYTTVGVDAEPKVDSFLNRRPNTLIKDGYLGIQNNYDYGYSAGGFNNYMNFRAGYGYNILARNVFTGVLYKDMLYAWGKGTNSINDISSNIIVYSYVNVNPLTGGMLLSPGKNHVVYNTDIPELSAGQALTLTTQKIIAKGDNTNKQSDFTTRYTDISIGNGYAFYITDLGLLLPKVTYNRKFYDNSEILYSLYRGGIIGGCEGMSNPFSSRIRAFRSIGKISSGEDQAIFITNEGKPMTAICTGRPNYFVDISNAQYDPDRLPSDWYGLSFSDIKLGYYHMTGIAKGKVYTYGVSPSYKFSRQYGQTVYPVGLEKVTTAKYLNVGKYSTNIITEKLDSRGNIVRRLWGYGNSQSI